MLKIEKQQAGFIQAAIQRQSHFFAVQVDDRIVAFLRIERCGETFVSESPAYLHVNGAYCLPEFRGQGLYPALINHALNWLKTENILRLGVDYETINPAADRFWSRHFHPYCYTVVRRIDEHALPVESGRKI
ncbi:MAG: GNAT family N-acetyltransferase [Eubacteriales bacterium]|nr:GNAT family N-acetyltransferase [Eubacteriales bacterium]